MRGTVLLVEDQDLLRSALRTYLELEGWETLESASAEEAKGLLPYCHILLTDLVLFGPKSGNRWLTYVRRHYPQLPIIIMTGSELRIIPEKIDAVTILTKPFDLGELSNALRKVRI